MEVKKGVEMRSQNRSMKVMQLQTKEKNTNDRYYQKTYVIVTGEFKEGGMSTKEFNEYSKRSNEIGEAHGGIVINRYTIENNLGEGATLNMLFVIQFPSKQKAIEAFTNEEYKSILPLRKIIFKEVNILISKE